MSKSKSKKKNDYDRRDDDDPKQDPKHDSGHSDPSQAQAQLQGQLQGQAQGQGQFQFAVQSVDTKVDNENSNENDNKNDNENSNENKNEVRNEVDNKVDNAVDNKLDNSIDNKVENTVENHVETKVDVSVDLDLDLDLSAFERPLDNDWIDIEEIKNIEGSVVMPDAVFQNLTGNGNQFNIDQVNNLVDKDFLYDPDVYMKDGELKWDVKAEGGEVKFDDPNIDINADGSTFGDGLAATADAIVNQEAFTQNIVMGANIQFNSIEMSVAGNDLTDDHSI